MTKRKLIILLILFTFLLSQSAFLALETQNLQIAASEETPEPETDDPANDDPVDRTIGSLIAFLIFGGLAGVFYLLRWYGLKTGKIERLE